MWNTTDPEMYSLITNVCKAYKNFEFPQIALSFCLFGLKNFYEFVILVGRIEPIACLVFYLVIKMWENLFEKPYQTWKTVKTFKKHQNVVTGTHKKRKILLHRFVVEDTLFLSIHLRFWKGRMKIS